MKATNKELFEQDVLLSKRLILLDVWAPFCAPCRGLEPIIDKISEEIKDWADVVKLDASVDMEFAQELGVSGLPTFLVYKNGQVMDSISGTITKDRIMDMLTKFVE